MNDDQYNETHRQLRMIAVLLTLLVVNTTKITDEQLKETLGKVQ